MADGIEERVGFPACRGRRVEAEFTGGDVTSDGGVLLRQADRKLGLLTAVAARLEDDRDPARCRHRLVDLLRQRVFGIALAYED